MASKYTYELKLSGMIAKVKDADTRTILSICKKNRKYPQDCITDGGIEKLVNYIISLEARP